MSFGNAIANYAKKTKLGIDEAIVSINNELVTNVMMKTPVASGRLASNWIPSFDDPSSTTTESTNTALAIMNASKFAKESAGRVLYLTNNLPYAHRVEYEGWSAIKAPKGMLRISLSEINVALMKFKTSK